MLRALRFVWLSLCAAAVWVSVASNHSAHADFIYDTFVAECRKSGGTPGSTLAQYERGEPFVCNQSGSAQSRGGAASNECKGEAKINIDWIFADDGARARFGQLRRAGKSPLDAAIGAQAHNPKVQKLLQRCTVWVSEYLQSLGSGGQVGDESGPTQADCRCISVVPAGTVDVYDRPAFTVSNSCPALAVKVRFTGDILSFAARADAFSAWGDAGRIADGGSSVVYAPDWTIVSIKAVSISNSVGSFLCNY